MPLNPVGEIRASLGLEVNGRTQKFFVDTCAKHMDKYVPMDTGELARTITKGPDYITYEMPYAHYQYRGISNAGNPLNYSTEKHALATSYWDRHMVTAEMPDVIKEVQDYMKR